MLNSIDTELQKQAKDYQHRKRVTSWCASGLVFLFLLSIYATGLSDQLAEALSSRWGFWRSILIYCSILFLAISLLKAPFDYKNDFLLEKEYGFSTQSRSDWLKDLFKSWFVNALILSAAASFTFWAFGAFPVFWWVVVGFGYFVLVVLLANLFPVLLLPLFFKLKPLEDTALREKIEQILQRARFSVQGVYYMVASAKTTKENAMLAGLGKAKRVILWDTLLRNRTPEEVEVIVAHEVGHSYHQHIWKLILGQGLLMMGQLLLLDFMLLQITSRYTPAQRTFTETLALLPLMLVLFNVISFLLSPVVHALSRCYERQADTFALEATAKPHVLIHFLVDLARRQLSDAYPHPLLKLFYYTHPPVGERIAYIERWSHKQGIALERQSS